MSLASLVGPAAVLLFASAIAGSEVATTRPAITGLGCGTRKLEGDSDGTRQLARGYVIEIRKDSVENYLCNGSVRNRDGRVVFANTGFGIRLDSATGIDVDGDGHGDVVLNIDTGGGNKCCTSFDVVSLFPNGHLVFTFEWEGFAEFRKDAAGRAILRSWEGSLQGVAPAFGGEQRISALRAYRFAGGKLVNVTPSQCAAIYRDVAWLKDPPASEIARFHAAGAVTDSTRQTAELVQVMMLQRIYCGQAAAALRIGRMQWLPADYNRFMAAFRDEAVRAKPEYRKELAKWR